MDPREPLLRLRRALRAGDVTEVERPYAKKTEYVGRLSDGKTSRLWRRLLVLGQPYAGRTPPKAAQTLNRERPLAARNRSARSRAWFSYLGLFEALEASGIKYVYGRPSAGGARRSQVFLRGVTYLGTSRLRRRRRSRLWQEGLDEPRPLAALEPRKALEIYRGRMKIEQSRAGDGQKL